MQGLVPPVVGREAEAGYAGGDVAEERGFFGEGQQGDEACGARVDWVGCIADGVRGEGAGEAVWGGVHG